jgi:NUBPL iron-transfer P-loop NTPase
MKHLDEAAKTASKTLSDLVEKESRLERAVLVHDLFGRLRVALWANYDAEPVIRQTIDAALKEVSSTFWTGEIWSAKQGEPTEIAICDAAWNQGTSVGGSARFREVRRYRSHGAWFAKFQETPWEVKSGDTESGPPIIVFYSFKGGVGRSTALASFAMQRAKKGEIVAVVDFDLDAPGIGKLLATDVQGSTANWGSVDYLLERTSGEVEISDYFHFCRREEVSGKGEIVVMPAGVLDGDYLGKLACVDFELGSISGGSHPLFSLANDIRKKFNPQWILFDARAGLSEPAGLLLSGFAHLHVLFGTSSEQSWQGLRAVITRLGADRVKEGTPQIECLLVQSMVPEDSKTANESRTWFAERARDEFSAYYYAEDPENVDEDKFWYVRDLEDNDSPHSPESISYQAKLALFGAIDDVSEVLSDHPEYVRLASRIASRFARIEE